MTTHYGNNRQGRTALYCIATAGLAVANDATAAPEELNGTGMSFPFTLTENEDEDVALDNLLIGRLFNLDVDGGTELSIEFYGDGNYGGSTMIHTVSLPGKDDHYMGQLLCGHIVSDQLQGLGGGGVNSTFAVGVYDGLYERLVNTRGYFGLRVIAPGPNASPGATGDETIHYAYLEYELTRDDTGLEPVDTITIFGGEIETEPDTPIIAGGANCDPILDLTLPAIIKAATDNQ